MKRYLAALLTNYSSLFLAVGIQIFLMPFLLQQVGRQMTGLYYLFITLSNFAAIGIGWLNGSGIYLIGSSSENRDREVVREIHRAVFIGYAAYATVLLVIAWLAGLFAGEWWLKTSDEALIIQGRNACLVLGGYIWFHYVHQADVSFFTALLEARWANAYRILSQVVFILVVWFFVRRFPRLDFLLLGNLLGIAVASVAARIHLRISGILIGGAWKLPDRALMKKIFITYGARYFFFGIARLGLIYGDVLLIGAVLGPESVAGFLIIWKIPDVAALLLGRISEILTPFLIKIHSRCAEETPLFFLCTSRIQHCLGIAAGFAYGVFGSTLVRFWVGEADRPDNPYIYWMAGAVLAIQVMNVHDVILHYALASLRRMMLIQYSELIFKTLLTLVLFDAVGIYAPLMAALMIQIPVLTWLYKGAALRQLRIHWLKWFSSVGKWALVFCGSIGLFGLGLIPFLDQWGDSGFFFLFILYLAMTALLLAGVEGIQKEKGFFSQYKNMASEGVSHG